jgi:hypothetical protein
MIERDQRIRSSQERPALFIFYFSNESAQHPPDISDAKAKRWQVNPDGQGILLDLVHEQAKEVRSGLDV